jgi:lipoate-protein ligase A
MEILRVWEPPHHFVVLGASSRFHQEASVANCQADQIPILRRPSGGAAILAGPGCLMYAVVLCLQERPELRSIDNAHQYVLGRIVTEFNKLLPGVERAGTSDLIYLGAKISGNALRVKRHHLLYHGTILYNFQLEFLPRYLATPPRMPAYRAARAHLDFVKNFPSTQSDLITALRSAFTADELLRDYPLALAAKLVTEKYSLPAWQQRL